MTLKHLHALLAATTLCLPAAAWAGAPVIGSGNVAVIEPPPSHPAETPCVVTLFANSMGGGNSVAFSYAHRRPARAPGRR